MGRALAVIVAGIGIYVVLPALGHVFSAWPRLRLLSPWWLLAMIVAEAGSFVCSIALLRMVVRTRDWFAVSCALLTGNAVTNILPAGDAAGAGVQYRMLSTAGIDAGQIAGGLATASALGLAGLLVLPVFALPALLTGLSISAGLEHAGELGIAGFVLIVAFSALVLTSDRALVGIAGALQWLVNVVRPHRKITTWKTKFLIQRDIVRKDLGENWSRATLLVAGRVGLDYLSLLAALKATGATPNPSLVILAYSATAVIALFPITPGGIGIVEASLSGLLVLASVPSSDALVATLAFRIGAYWMPVVTGGVLYLLFRRRYGALANVERH